jgi:phosphatidate cytidylyltransferase
MESLKKALHMALNKEVFKTRTQTAVLYAVVMLTGLLWNEWSFIILFSIVHFGAWYEFRKLVERIGAASSKKSPVLSISLAFLGWGILLAANAESLDIGGYHISEAGWRIMRISFIAFLIEIYRTKGFNRWNLGWSFIGLAYVSIPLAMLVNLRSGWIWGQSHDSSFFVNALSGFSGKVICLLLVFGIWVNDTMAYIVGSFIGKTPLSKWSPKKTWEGTLGGIILSIALISTFGWFYGAKGFEWMLVTSVAAIAGTFGDLLESRLKRMAGVKDSGSFMPGHGGFLDRFDSIILAVPAVWLVCYLLYR